MIASRIRLALVASAAAAVLAACGSSSYSSSSTAAGSPATTAASSAAGSSATTAAGGDAYGYGGGGAPTTASPATTAASGGGAAVALAKVGDLGSALVDSKGMTLYLFEKDTGGKSTCSDACANAWPAATVTGSPTAGAGLDASKLSTTTRDDGKTQLVYNGHPLYTFAGDAAPGQASGQGTGGVWYVVNAAGDKIDND